ncbi:HTH_Tnp_Tc3_2 domain-containing protein [Trichonephila clavipes]|nr:HTH_Tnp_Tc3_2 domain-containing protein [Trichonephila clavipes]
MDVRKCIVPMWHGGTLNSRRAASPLVRLVEEVERWEAPDSTLFSFKIGVETSQIVLSPIEYFTSFQASRDAKRFYLNVAGITIRLLALVTLHAVYFEAGDWRENYAGHLSVGWIKGGQRLTCLRTVKPEEDPLYVGCLRILKTKQNKESRKLSRLVKQNLLQVVGQLTSQYNAGSSANALEHTAWRTLLDMGLRSRRCPRGPLLTKRRCQLRIVWDQKH